MNKKVKGAFSILLMAVAFYMMITTKYTHALGDYLLEYVGVRSWTGDYSGIHLTVIYFGIIFIITLFFVEKYAVAGLNFRKRNVFIIFIILITIFSSITGITARNIKKSSSGLLAIGLNSSDSFIKYGSEDDKFVEFTAEFELTNYSDEKKTFYLNIVSPFDRKEEMKEISFYTFDGKRAIFKLEENETKSFLLNLDNYNVVGGSEFQNGSGRGIIEEIILTNDKGEKVRLNRDNFFGIVIGR